MASTGGINLGTETLCESLNLDQHHERSYVALERTRDVYSQTIQRESERQDEILALISSSITRLPPRPAYEEDTRPISTMVPRVWGSDYPTVRRYARSPGTRKTETPKCNLKE